MRNLTPRKLATILQAFQKSRNDGIVVISGDRGIGKSVLMIQIAKNLLGGYYDFDKYHIYQRKELQQKLEQFTEKNVLCVDEAITTLFKREFQKKSQINIIKMFNMYRDKYFIIFLLIPHFWDLDASVRNSLIIKYWIYCYKRGDAVIFTHDQNPGNPDPFDRRNLFWFWRANRIYKHNNYVANIQWTDIPGQVYEEYKRVKGRKRIIQEQQEKKPLTKKETIEAIKLFNPKASPKIIAEMIKTAPEYVSKVTN